MDRIKADKRAATYGHLWQHPAQIAKVANAPVLCRAQGIELHAGSPQRLTRQQCRGFITAGRHNNHPARPLLCALLQRQLMIAFGQRRQMQRPGGLTAT